MFAFVALVFLGTFSMVTMYLRSNIERFFNVIFVLVQILQSTREPFGVRMVFLLFLYIILFWSVPAFIVCDSHVILILYS